MTIRIKGLRLISRASDGSIVLARYHPPGCNTWHWSVYLKKYSDHRPKTHKADRRVNQWHDYYRLPFGWTIMVSQQDYHKQEPNT